MVTGEILDASAAQLLGTTLVDARHASVGVRIADSGRDEKIPVELGADGWKIVVPAKMIDKVKRKISPAPAPPPGK